jgi:dTMP kinase
MSKRNLDKLGKLIVIDGMDGSGKGTQIKLIEERLKNSPVLFTREPGGSPKAEEIRSSILKTGGPKSNAVCDFFLFWAARGSHIEDVVTPARQKGKHVICDRFDSSTFAFQIYGEKHPWLRALFKKIRGSLPARYKPDLYIVLDLPPRVAYERRRKNAEQEKSKFDIQPLAYHTRVRNGFKKFAEEFGHTRFVDANRTPQEIHKDVWGILKSMI